MRNLELYYTEDAVNRMADELKSEEGWDEVDENLRYIHALFTLGMDVALDLDMWPCDIKVDADNMTVKLEELQ